MEYTDNLVELYKNVRQQHVANMQSSLKELRSMLDLSVQSFGDYIGLSRQSINSLESNRTKLSESQYLAICALIENKLKDKPYLWPGVLQALKFGVSTSCTSEFIDQASILSSYNDSLLENPSLLNDWFNSFPNIATADEKLRVLLETIINEDNKIFVDDSFLMMPGVNKVLELLDPMLLAEHNKLFVPLVVIRKLKLAQQQASLNGDGILTKRLDDTIKALTNLKNHRLLAVRGESSDIDVETTLKKVFSKFKTVHNMVLLSGNEKICESIGELNQHIVGPEIEIYIYKDFEGLKQWGLTSLDDQISVEGWETLDNNSQIDENERFSQSSEWEDF